MKARDLRIGNWLITTMARNEYQVLPCHLGDEDEECLLESEPIPLTEEWLVRFGFEYTEIHEGFNQYRKDLLNLSITPNGFEIFLTFKWINIKHVHQLQNLYFALTGEELTLQH